MRHYNVDDTAKGLLHPDLAGRAFTLTRYPPHPQLRPWVEFYWSVSWDLGWATHEQVVVSNPTVDLSFEDDPATNGPAPAVFVTGVEPRAYLRRLQGRSQVFAVHFAPAMFRPWWSASVGRLTGRAQRLPVGPRPWEHAAGRLLPELLSLRDGDRPALVDEMLLRFRPPVDPIAAEIRDLVQAARHHRTLWDPTALAERRSVSVRTNQRHFVEYVGVGPKWIARRFRIQAALDVLDADRTQGRSSDLSILAQSLGYYDHAHFTRDFRETAGLSPNAYRRRRGRSPDG